jgi:hypothetical protein
VFESALQWKSEAHHLQNVAGLQIRWMCCRGHSQESIVAMLQVSNRSQAYSVQQCFGTWLGDEPDLYATCRPTNHLCTLGGYAGDLFDGDLFAADLGTPSVAACHVGQVIRSPVLGEKTLDSSAQIKEASVPSTAMAGADPDGNPGLEALSVQEQSQESQPEASGKTRAADKILSTPSGPGCEASASWLAAAVAVSRSLCSGGVAGMMMLLLSFFFLPVFLYQALIDNPTGGRFTWLLQVFFCLACVPLVRWVCLGRCRLPVRPS